MTITNLDVAILPQPASEAATRPDGALRGTAPLGRSDAVQDKQAARAGEPATEASGAVLADNVQQLNAALSNFGIEFDINEADHRLIVRVVDRDSGELIRQIPSEEVLRMTQSLEQLRGLLLQHQA